jgi:hypothetical protein
MNKRIFYSDNGILRDFSVNLNKYDEIESEFHYIPGEDYIYIGSRLPFNSLYFKVTHKNTRPANMYVEVFDGQDWEFVNELIDETGAFAKSGYITFTPDRDTGWAMEDTSGGGDNIPGLETLKIYDKYWMRISFDAELSNHVCLSWIGHIFADDADLGSEYPDLTKQSVKAAFKPGKQNWEEQLVRASEVIIEDLMINRNILDSSQILDRYDYRSACIQKCAEIIFNAFGDDFVDQKQRAREEYQRRLSIPTKKIDTNANAIEEVSEARNGQGWLSR